MLFHCVLTKFNSSAFAVKFVKEPGLSFVHVQQARYLCGRSVARHRRTGVIRSSPRIRGNRGDHP